MTPKEVRPLARGLSGRLRVPGDKSIAHRALIAAALARGRSRIVGAPDGADVRSTGDAIGRLGAGVRVTGSEIVVEGAGLDLGANRTVDLDCGNSGTTMRMLAGVVAARPGTISLHGDASLSRRPMERVARPLRAMGADVDTREGFPPIVVRGGDLRPIHWVPEVASAQVKSAILFAGLRTSGETIVADSGRSRDHTERLLAFLGAQVERRGDEVLVRGNAPLRSADLWIPGDPSSAAFWVVAASLVPGSHLLITDVCVNETRLGFLGILRRMGADVTVRNRRELAGEPWADLDVRAASLRGTVVAPEEIPAAIDELPILAIAAAGAEGETSVTGAGELRAKESDRLAAIEQLAILGVDIRVLADGFVVRGRRNVPIEGGDVLSHGDHRIAMAFAVAGLVSRVGVGIDDVDVVGVSYPSFFSDLAALTEPAP